MVVKTAPPILFPYPNLDKILSFSKLSVESGKTVSIKVIMLVIIGKSILYTILILQIIYAVPYLLNRETRKRQIWLLGVLLFLGLRLLFAPASHDRLLMSFLLIISAGNYLSTLENKPFPVLWNAVGAGILASWVSLRILDYPLIFSFDLFSVLTIAFVSFYPLSRLLRYYGRARSRFLLVWLGLSLIWVVSGGLDFAFQIKGGFPFDFGLWFSFLFSLAIFFLPGYREGVIFSRSLEKRLLPNGRSRSELINRLEQTEANLLVRDRLISSGYMAAGIVHEFKNILSQINLCTEYGMSHPDVESKDRSLKAVRDNVEAAKKSVTSLLERLAITGREKAVPVHIKETLELLVNIVKASYRTEGIQVKLSVEGNPAITIRKGEIEQILLNLIRNSAEAYRQYRDGKPKLIFLKSCTQKKETIIEVTDQAGGIPSGIQGVLFDPPSMLKPRGLGLYLSKRLIARNGGSLEYHPVENGSCFRLLFPETERL